MSILQGYKKVKRYIKENDGYKEISQHVYSDTVEMSNGTDLETTITNMESAIADAKTYTDTEIANLVGTAPETLNTLEEVAKAIEEHQDVTDALNAAIGNKVSKEEGKGLSTNDYTTEEKEKLADIEEGANKYTLPTATDTVLGGVKIGDNITNTEGVISVNEENISDALGFTPIADMEVASGTEVVATNSAEGFVTDFSCDGNVEQKQYSGKNLLNNTATTQTKNGVTFTINADKSVTANGTATANAYIDIGIFTPIVGENYSFTSEYGGCYILNVNGVVDWRHNRYDWTATTTDTIQCRAYVATGTTVNNLTFYPMIRPSNTDATYEPYTGGALPNPSYPQAIFNSGDCVELQQGGYSGAAGVHSLDTKIVSNVNKIPCQSGDVVKIDLEIANSIALLFYNEHSYLSYVSTPATTSYEATIPSGVTHFNFNIANTAGLTVDAVGKVELTINGKYVLQVKSITKNILNPQSIRNLSTSNIEVSDDVIYSSGIDSRIWSFANSDFLCNVNPDTQYRCTIFVDTVETAQYAEMHVYDSNGTNLFKQSITNISDKVSFKFTPTTSLVGLVIKLDKGRIRVQIEREDVASGVYQRFKESISTILLDEPTRSNLAGTVKDIITCEDSKYIVRRKFIERVLDGSDDEQWSFNTFAWITLGDVKLAVPTEKANIVCSHYPTVIRNELTNVDYGVSTGTSVNAINFYNKNITSLADWKALLASNPMTVQYELLEEVIEDIADQTPFYQIQTYDGGTTISTTDRLQPQIEVEYPTNRVSGVASEALSDANTIVGDISNSLENKVDKISGKGLSTNDYTTTEKNKLAGIAAGAEVNQNAFSNVTVGTTTIAANGKTDTLTLVAGSNVTLTPDATNDKITIAATDTTALTSMTGTLPVNKGGTGATTLTSGQALIGNGTDAVTTRAITHLTATNNLGWTSATTTNLVTLGALTYWNGRYSSTGSSLEYCKKGAFGDAAVKGITAEVTSGNYNLVTSHGVHDALTKKTTQISLGSVANEVRYEAFARMANNNSTGNGHATFLVSGLGNYGGVVQGTYLVTISNRGSTPTMTVTTIRQNDQGTVTFGYYTSGSYFYFGVYSSQYRGALTLTVIQNEGASVDSHYKSTTAPTGWTTVTPKTFSDSSHTHSYLPSSGGTLTSTTANVLTVKSNNASAPALITFSNSAKDIVQIGGYPDDNNLHRINGSVVETILDTGNYKSHITPANIGAATESHTHNYLSLSGGTITSTSVNGLTIKRSTNAPSTIMFSNSAGDRMQIGTVTTDLYLHRFNASGSNVATIIDTGNYDALLDASAIKNAVTSEELSSTYTLLDNAKMEKSNPTGTGYLSLNRLANSTVGEYSTTEGYNCTASGHSAHAEGYETTATGTQAHAEGCMSDATNNYAHAEGYDTTASGNGSHAEGKWSVASGEGAHAEGYSTDATATGAHAEGSNALAEGNYSHAEGYYTTASGLQSHAEGCGSDATGEATHASGRDTIASNFGSTAIGKFNKAMTDGGAYNTQVGDVFAIGNGSSTSARSNAFRVTYTGASYGLSAFNSSGADYAEFVYPWYDDNANNEDRIGYFVTFKDGKLYKATSTDVILGVTSGNPSIIGNADEDYYWKYERDEFNRIIWEDVEEEIEIFDEEGNRTTEKTGNIIKNGRMKLNPDYDPSLQSEYVERKDRAEWDYVGMVGMLPVHDDGTCVPGQYCKCNDEGIATLATAEDVTTNRFTYIVLERVSDNVVKILK